MGTTVLSVCILPYLFVYNSSNFGLLATMSKTFNVAFPAQQFRSNWISAHGFVPGLLLVLGIMLILK